MNILGIDTSSAKACVALKADRLYLAESEGDFSHCESLSKLVTEVLTQARISLNQVNLITLGAGPGSFTGLRISYSFVRGITAVNKIKVTEYCSLQAMAASQICNNQVKNIVAFSDARQQEVFINVYSIDNFLAVFEVPKIVKLDRVMQLLSDNKIMPEDAIFVSDFNGLNEFKENLRASNKLIKLPENIAVGLIRLSELNLNISDGPLYVRKVNALTIAQRAA